MLIYFLVLAALLAIGQLCDLQRRVRRLERIVVGIVDLNEADNNTMFRQLEALHSLYVDLEFKKSLPATRGWAASPDFLLALAHHALAEKPAVVVECSSGTSTVILARCMQLNGGGMVYSLEHDAGYAQKTRAELERHGLSAHAQVLYAPLNDFAVGADRWQWYVHDVLPPLPQIDLIAIDGPPKDTGPLARYPAGPVLFPRLAPGGTVFLDDARRPDEQAIVARWLKEFPRLRHSNRPCEKGCAILSLTPGT